MLACLRSALQNAASSFFFLSESHQGLQHLEKHPVALTPWEDVLLKCKWIPAYVLTSQDGAEKYNRELRSWWISGNNNRKKPQRTPNLLALISMHRQSTASLSCSAAPCPCSCWGWAASQQCAVAAAFGAAAQHPRGNGLLLCPSSSAASRSSHSCILSPAFPFLFFFFFFLFESLPWVLLSPVSSQQCACSPGLPPLVCSGVRCLFPSPPLCRPTSVADTTTVLKNSHFHSLGWLGGKQSASSMN